MHIHARVWPIRHWRVNRGINIISALLGRAIHVYKSDFTEKSLRFNWDTVQFSHRNEENERGEDIACAGDCTRDSASEENGHELKCARAEFRDRGQQNRL